MNALTNQQQLIIIVAILTGIVIVLGVLVAWQVRLARKRRPADTPVPQVQRIDDTAPPPVPSIQQASPSEPAPDIIEVDSQVLVSTLALRDFRSYTALSIGFDLPKREGAGQWAVLLGDNGVGKSTILRGLVLALADPAVCSSLLQSAGAPFVRRRAPDAKDEERPAGIDVMLRPKLLYSVNILPSKPAERLHVREARRERPALFAYGPLRGSALGGSARQVSFLPVGPVATLFDERAELIHAETWLMQLQLAAYRSTGGAAEAFFEAVTQTVCELLPGVETMEVTETGVLLSGPEVGARIPLAGMSDAYLGTMGWVLDFIARWSHRYQRVTNRVPDGSIARDARGLVLVDEIGLHLHPLWQTSVVKDLRAKFPNVSFIVTSHNPLILLGAQEGEVHVLRRNLQTREVQIEQANVPPGTTADQILTGRWFNLPSTLDDDTQRLLEEHRTLLRRGEDEGHPRVSQLQDELRQRLGTFADTSLDRMALEVASQVMREKESSFSQLSPEGRERLRDEMLRQLKERDRSK
jgi:hypothetical protein